MPDDVRDGVTRAAAVQNRSVTAEINMRLRDSLKPQAPPASAPLYAVGATSSAGRVEEKTRDLRNSELEEAILAVIRGMPPEKQLAFLTLFK